MTLGDVAAAVRGRLSGADPDTRVYAPVEFDSRKARPGGLFLALLGEHVDGHDYVDSARAAGAVAAIVTRPVEGPSILVADGLAALSALASVVIRRLPDILVVGITGSSGKTSTKDLVSQLLERLGPTVAPPESFNNELGHPYTVLLSTVDTKYLVLETSARKVGHIRDLAEIAPPRIGVVLNVGSAHLGEFGSQAAIAQAKGELVEALPADGVAILNADDPLVAAMSARTAARVVTFGEGGDVWASDVRLDDLGRPSFTLHAGDAETEVSLRLSGEHQVANSLAAAAVALEFGLPLPDVAAALSAATRRSKWRMEITERPDGVVVINDAYNANPESMRAALNGLAEIGRHRAGRTWAVLGQMAELGDIATDEHDALGRLAASQVSRVVAVGEPARVIAHGADLAGGDAQWVPDADAAITLLEKELQPGDVVLVKASRAVGLESVALELGR
ncbi:MAG TPA: UDP-N-acetylmuramoyl-tripeptide--D-alanyl-D-alanine ligase [Jatrophihabitantaceae bacterium]|nr:UDP-N-acetylmuramoyl-tripeptide--D-alanyl-D-alanine ligase [Jatrophihabitantaceae bacterium]